MCASDRQFKMRSLPNFAFLVVPVLMLFLQSRTEDGDFLLGALPYVPYMFLLMVPATWDVARFAEAWEGRWVLEELEPHARCEFTRGAMKAAVARYLFVPLGLLSLPLAFFLGVRGLPDLCLAASLVAAATFRLLPKFGGDPPFTQKAANHLGQSNLVLMFGVMAIAALLGAAQFALGYVPFAVPLLAPVALAAAVLSWRALARVPLRLKDEPRARRRRGAIARR
jgi:hypothetical protein